MQCSAERAGNSVPRTDRIEMLNGGLTSWLVLTGDFEGKD